MNILIVYYTRKGKTQKIAQMFYRVCKEKKYDVDIIRLKPEGRFGIIKAAVFTLLNKSIRIKPVKKDIKDYNLIIIGGPAWISKPTPPVSAFIDELSDLSGKEIVTYVTVFSSGGIKALNSINKRINSLEGKIIATKDFPVRRMVTREVLSEASELMSKIIDKI